MIEKILKRCEFFRFYLYLCHVLLRFTLVLICNTKIGTVVKRIKLYNELIANVI